MHRFNCIQCIHFCPYSSPLAPCRGLLALTAADFRSYLIRKNKSQVFGGLSEGGADPGFKMVRLPVSPLPHRRRPSEKYSRGSSRKERAKGPFRRCVGLIFGGVWWSFATTERSSLSALAGWPWVAHSMQTPKIAGKSRNMPNVARASSISHRSRLDFAPGRVGRRSKPPAGPDESNRRAAAGRE
jgi:hypothetical protein